MNSRFPDADETLLERVRGGDKEAVNQLLSQHRERLRRLIAMRLGPSIHRRVDASDVVQETLMEAAQRIPDYLERQPMPFYLWLRKTALQRLIVQWRRHVSAEGRSVAREIPLSDNSCVELGRQIADKGPTPSGEVNRLELAAVVRRAVERLPEQDREIVIMRSVEGLSYADISAVMQIEEPTARKRHERAVSRLRSVLVRLGLVRAQ